MLIKYGNMCQWSKEMDYCQLNALSTLFSFVCISEIRAM